MLSSFLNDEAINVIINHIHINDFPFISIVENLHKRKYKTADGITQYVATIIIATIEDINATNGDDVLIFKRHHFLL